jgi:hypothetical protein
MHINKNESEMTRESKMDKRRHPPGGNEDRDRDRARGDHDDDLTSRQEHMKMLNDQLPSCLTLFVFLFTVHLCDEMKIDALGVGHLHSRILSVGYTSNPPKELKRSLRYILGEGYSHHSLSQFRPFLIPKPDADADADADVSLPSSDMFREAEAQAQAHSPSELEFKKFITDKDLTNLHRQTKTIITTIRDYIVKDAF